MARLETLPAYAVGGAEAERITAHDQGLARPERSVRTDPWLARIAVGSTTGGKSWERVRVVDTPLTAYQRYQLDSYREAQACGDQVSLALRSDVGDVAGDFWLFDAGTDRAHAVLMHYCPDGSLDRREPVDDPVLLVELTAELDRVRTFAVPLNAFLLSSTVTGA